MVQNYTWYKFEEAKPKEGSVVLVQDGGLITKDNPKGIALGNCWGYSMTVVALNSHTPAFYPDFRPEFWATLGNENPKDIFEKPPYLDVTKEVYPPYEAEWRFRGRPAKKKSVEPEAEEIDIDDIDLEDEDLY